MMKGIKEGMKVRVYRNLTKKCFSVKCMKTNRVVAHIDKLFLENVTFPVSKKSRERVLKSKQKNVHAFIQGFICKPKTFKKDTKVSYNPYKYPFFYDVEKNEEVKLAKYCSIDLRKGIHVNN